VVEDKGMIMHILMTNGLDQYHLFKGNILTHNQLLKTGLNIGTIAKFSTPLSINTNTISFCHQRCDSLSYLLDIAYSYDTSVIQFSLVISLYF
jgi:hypothetical protein